MREQNTVTMGDLVVRINNKHPSSCKAKLGLISKVNGGENTRGHVYYGAWNSMDKDEWRFATLAEIKGYNNGLRMSSVKPLGSVDNYSII